MPRSGLNIESFRRWAFGDLTDNRNRGILAEWLVGPAARRVRQSLGHVS